MSIPEVADIIEDLGFFDDWEERYKYIIDLGKELPPMDSALQTPDRLVKGCQSNVWLEVRREAEKLHFIVDSDAFIVKGLLMLVLAAYEGKSAEDILAFDVDGYFHSLDLERHLSPTRGNGLRAIVAKIRAVATAAQAG